MLSPTVLPSNATNREVSWSSSNSSVASVSPTGLVTAVSVGTATITVSTVDGNKTATCQVTTAVKEDDGSTYVPDPSDPDILFITEPGENNIVEVTLDRNYKQIYVNAPEQQVTINLTGQTIENSENSPIFVQDCDSIDISAKNGTTSYIKDTRPLYESEDSAQGKGAIFVEDGDLTLKGKGALNITASYYNGVHAKKDVEIKNLSLSVTAPGHAIKGKDSIEVASGTLNLVCGGDGLHSDDSDISSKEKQRGNVTISGGTLTINSWGDAITAAYNAEISGEASITARTYSYSSYDGEKIDSSKTTLYLKMNSSTYSSGNYTYAAYINGVWYPATYDGSQSSSSNGGPGGGPGGGGWGGGSSTYYFYKLSKPIDASNFTLYRFAGSSVTEFSTSSYNAKSDATSFNTNYDTVTVSYSSSKLSLSGWSTHTSGNSRTGDISCKGIKAENEVIISGGTIDIKAYDDGIHANNDGTIENGEVPTGNVSISGGTMTIESTDDGIHADGTLEISGGEIHVTKAYEGLEGNIVNVSGGSSYVVASDDGMNASSGKSNPAINITGGYVDVQVPASGDTDGIDSNGTFTLDGGIVIVAGPGSASGTGGGGGSFALDTDTTITFKSGTIAIFGGIERTPTNSLTRTLVSSNNVSSGSHTISVGSNSYTTNLISTTKGCVVYSDQGSASLS